MAGAAADRGPDDQETDREKPMDASRWFRGPVAITGASGQVGTALQKRLADLPNEVRALGRDGDLEAAFRGVDVVVHLAGTLAPRRPNTYRAANLATVGTTVAALRGSGAKRVVFLSYVDADPASRNPYLRYKGEAEGLLGDSGTPAVIIRSTHIYGTRDDPGPTVAAMLSKDEKPVWVMGPGTQRYAWVARDDVVEAIVRAAVDPEAPIGALELAGPEAVTADDFIRHVNGEDVRIRHLAPWAAGLMGRLLPSLPSPLVDVMLRDSLPKGAAPDAAERLGLRLRTLEEMWRP
jgi:uncharacterized protein YbjT (DUF2867 family)